MNQGASSPYQSVALGKGAGWSPPGNTSEFPLPSSTFSFMYVNEDMPDSGLRFGDVDGDGKDDALMSFTNTYNSGDMSYRKLFKNGGTSIVLNTSYTLTGEPFSTRPGNSTGGSFFDLNNDGRADNVLQGGVYFFCDGATLGWQNFTTLSVSGAGWGQMGLIGDFNADGLTDFKHDYWNGSTYTPRVAYYAGTSYVDSGLTLTAPVPVSGIPDNGIRSMDINADGLLDIIQSKEEVSCSSSCTSYQIQGAYINTGVGFTSESVSIPSTLYLSRATFNGYYITYTDSGERILDVDGDMMPDFVGPTGNYRNTGKRADILKKVTTPQGGTIAYTYKTSLQYKNSSGDILNTEAPYPVYVVDTVATNDGQGFTDTKTYKYEGAFQYYAAYNDKQFGGFSVVTATDSAGNYTKTYYHQGNGSNTSQGEYSDHPSKIGRVYRIEKYNSSNNLLSAEINKWESNAIGSRYVVNNTETKSLSYEGDSSHKDRAVTRTFDSTNNNLLTETDWGEVTASADGTYTDTGSDKATVEYTYATDSAGKVLNKVSKKVVKNQSNTIVAETKSTYDSLSWGSVSTGNETKTEQLITGSTYATTNRAFNSYGLITSVTNPRSNATTYTYDSQNLYPATSTNASSQVTNYQYNQSVGKPKLVTDPNGYKVETTYDGLGRVVLVRTSDLSSPSSLLTSKQYTYSDVRNATSVYEKTNITSTVFQDAYTYVDGFNRPIQKRISGEGSQYSVSDTVYGRDGLVTTQSLPYFSAGGAKTSALNNASLNTTYTYDGLNRQLTATTISGAITTTYTDWKKTVVDQLSKQKAYETDAKGNLIKVTEYVSSTPYNTQYTYDVVGNLTNITDAQGNTRAFTYDSLSRRTGAEDLHASADSTFGTWAYVYDAQGNKTQETQPRGTVVDYVYDALDRVTSENAPSTGGTDITYTYDSGTYGVGRLSSATRGTTTTDYTYNVRGDVASEVKTIASDAFTTSYEYNRRGDVTQITTPDSAQVRYTYNQAGNIDRIERKESGGSWTPVVTNYDYGPHGKVTVKQTANNTWTYNTYDPNELYRLRNISTIDPPAEVPVEEQEQSIVEDVPPSEQASENIEVVESDTKEATEQAEEKPIEQPTTVFEEQKTETVLENPIEQAIKDVAEVTLLNDPSLEPNVNAVEELSAITTLAHDGEQELKTLRTENSYTIRVARNSDGTETRTTRLFNNPIHYKESEGGKYVLKPIDMRLRQDADSFDSVAGPFKIHISKDVSDGLATVTTGALSVTMQPQLDSDANVNKKAQRKKDSGKYIVDSPDALGDGLSTSMRADTTGVIKDIVIESSDSLENLKQSDEYYEIPFVIKTTEGAILTVEGQEVGDSSVETTNQVMLSLGDDKLYIKPAFAIDSKGLGTNITLVFQRTEGGFILTKKIPKVWFEKVAYPVTTDAVLSYYPDTTDGGIVGSSGSGWAAARSATTGAYMGTNEYYGSMASSSGGGSYSIGRAFYNFNTGSLPDDAIVTSAILKLAYANHYSYETGAAVLVTPNTLSSTTSLSLSDFPQVTDTALSAERGIGGGTVGAYMNFTLNSTGMAYINKTGWTQLATRTSFDVNNTAPGNTNYQNFYFTEATGTSMDPYLEVTYTVPTIPPTAINLKVGGLSNPTSISTGTPAFTATYNDPDEVDQGAHYQLQVVADTGSFSSPLWDSTKTAFSPKLNQGDTTPSITYGGTALPLNYQKYKWRIKYWDDSGTEGDWTDGTDTFIVTPVVTATTDMFVGCTTAQAGTLNPEGVKCVAPTFSTIYNIGTSGTTANKYRVQVATTNDFTSGIVWDSGSSGTSMPSVAWNARTSDLVYKGSALAMNGARYYWRIKFWTTGNVESSWSSVGTFTTYSSRVYQNINYTYDAVGNITDLVDGSDLQSKKDAVYAYDDLHRLTSATITNSASGATNYTQTYTYDILGNITNKSDIGSYTYAGTGMANPHAATSVAGSTYTYDDNGNVLTDGTRTLTWNYDNTLATALKSSVTTTYAYDHARGRVSQGNGTVTTKYPNKYYNIDSTGKKTKHIFAGDQAVAVIEAVGSTVTPRYIHNDQLGSSSVITTETVQYNHPPKITLAGLSTIVLNQGDSYTEYGATAVDDEDGQITPGVSISGTVDTATVGSYFKTYTSTDSGGATSTIIRTIVVQTPNPGDLVPTPYIKWDLDGTYNSTQKHSNTGSASGYSLTSNGYSSVAGKSGASDTAAQFNGTGDHFTTSTYDPGSNNFTVGVRFKANNYSMYQQTLLYEGHATNSNDNFNIHLRYDNRLSCEINGSGAVSGYINPLNWNDVVCIKNGSYMYIYVNGTYHNNSGAPAFAVGSNLYIGRANFPGSTNNFYLDGVIDSIKLYHGAAFTWQQVPGIFAGPSNVPPTIILPSEDPLVVQLGSTFTDPGATASDTEDGSLTGSISATGTVDTSTLGTYERVYSVTDAGGINVKKARTVVVVPTGDLTPTEAEVTDYFPYGSQRFDTGSYNSQRKYIGQYYDAAPDIMYLNARYYDSNRGQFISQDPVFWWRSQNLADPQTLNSYSYASGNPIANKDPLGLFTVQGTATSAISNMWSTGAGTISFIQNVYSSPSTTFNSAVQGLKSAVQSIGTGKGSQVTQNFFYGTDEQQDNILGGIIGDAAIGGAGSGVIGKLVGSNKYIGGAYKDVKGIKGREAHHMPADSISPYSRGKGPSVSMKPQDHRMTQSYGNTSSAAQYRAAQQNLIQSGDFRGAFEMDVSDLQSLFGSRYDSAIQQARTYMNNLLNK